MLLHDWLLHDWLIETKASDIMVRKLVTALPSQPLAEVAAILLREQISGLPVVDEAGVCRGVFAVSDVLRAEEKAAEKRQEVLRSDYFKSDLTLPESMYFEKLEQFRDQLATTAEQPIEHFMITDLVTVDINTPLEKVVQAMVDAHLHRVLVTEQDGLLRGIISTIDVLAALLRGAHQRKSQAKQDIC